MAQMDAFSAQIVKFVREMPDEALLDLVKQKLGVLAVPSGRHDGRKGLRGLSAAPVPPVPPVPLPAPRGKRSPAPSRARPSARASAERQGVLDSVERVVKGEVQIITPAGKPKIINADSRSKVVDLLVSESLFVEFVGPQGFAFGWYECVGPST